METPTQERNDVGEGEELHSENDTSYLVDPFTVMFADPELKDVAVSFALSGHSLEEALEHFRTVQDSKSAGLEGQYKAQNGIFENALKRDSDGIDIENKNIAEARSKIDRLREEKKGLIKRLQGLRVEISKKLLIIRKARLEKEERFFKDEEEHLRQEAEKSHQEALQDMNNQLELANKAHELKQQRWELNEKEYERRRAMLKDEQTEVEERLRKTQERIEKLAAIGITRTTAGFLVWVGYVSFAGISGVIANLLARREEKGTDYVGLFIKGISNLIGTTDGQNLWVLFAKLFGFVLTALLVIYVVLRLVDKSLGKFDQDWLKGSEKKKGKKARNSKPDIQTQFSLNVPEINRKSYVQLFAAFPYIIIAAIVVFIFALAGNPLDPASKVNLGTTYIGFVFTLLTTSVLILYTTYVIEPRWYKHGDQQERYSYFAKMKAHWEFVVLLLLLITSLIYAGFTEFAPDNPSANARVWGLLALFMALSSLGLAYGLVQRGLFKDADYLKNDLRLHRRLIEQYSTLPTVDDEFEYAEPKELSEILADSRKTRQELNELRLMYGIKRAFADGLIRIHDFEVLRYWIKSKRSSNLKRFRKLMRLPGPLRFLYRMGMNWKFEKSSEPDVIDYEEAPDETMEVKEFGRERMQTEEDIKHIDQQIADQEKGISASEVKLVALASEMEKNEAKKAALAKRYEGNKVYLVMLEEKERIRFIQAFRVGEFIAGRLGYKKSQPPPQEGTPTMTGPLNGDNADERIGDA